MGRFISSWLRPSCAARSPLTPAPARLHSLRPAPGAWRGASRPGSQPCGEPQPANSQVQGAGEEPEAVPKIWGSGEHQVFQKAWLHEFLVSFLSVPVPC